MGSMMATAMVFGTIVSTVSSFFEGQSIAVLPFEPIWMVKSMAHRGLVNPQPTDCSFIFLVKFVKIFEKFCLQPFFQYIMSTMALRHPIQKILGTAQSRSASKYSGMAFQPPSDPKQTYGSGNY